MPGSDDPKLPSKHLKRKGIYFREDRVAQHAEGSNGHTPRGCERKERANTWVKPECDIRAEGVAKSPTLFYTPAEIPPRFPA